MHSVACARCGVSFEADGRGAHARRYCSVDCADVAKGKCMRCGEVLAGMPTRNPRKWCSDTCRIAFYYETHPDKKAEARAVTKERLAARRPIKFCERCGARKKSGKGRFCSSTPECRAAAVKALRSQKKPCASDGCDRPSQGRGFCATHYAKWWRENNREKSRANARKNRLARRALLAGVSVDDVDPVKVFEADGWRCHLCGKKIDRVLRWPHLMCATVDHVIPLSKGGSHSYENCRAAHYGCNAAKSNRSNGDQMLLLTV